MDAFLRFCLVGVVGFVCDAGLTLLFSQVLHWEPLLGRAAAFVLAASVTWTLNRRFTFRSKRGVESWLPYTAATAVGALINVGTFAAWVAFASSEASDLLIGVALGSLFALGFNFLVSRAIFRRGGGAQPLA